jgi:hypothetical protein
MPTCGEALALEASNVPDEPLSPESSTSGDIRNRSNASLRSREQGARETASIQTLGASRRDLMRKRRLLRLLPIVLVSLLLPFLSACQFGGNSAGSDSGQIDCNQSRYALYEPCLGGPDLSGQEQLEEQRLHDGYEPRVP